MCAGCILFWTRSRLFLCRCLPSLCWSVWRWLGRRLLFGGICLAMGTMSCFCSRIIFICSSLLFSLLMIALLWLAILCLIINCAWVWSCFCLWFCGAYCLLGIKRWVIWRIFFTNVGGNVFAVWGGGGGLNQVIFLLLFLWLFSFVLFVRGSNFLGSLSLGVFPLLFWMVLLLVYFSSSLCPLFFSTLLQGFAAS